MQRGKKVEYEIKIKISKYVRVLPMVNIAALQSGHVAIVVPRRFGQRDCKPRATWTVPGCERNSSARSPHNASLPRVVVLAHQTKEKSPAKTVHTISVRSSESVYRTYFICACFFC